MDEFTKGQKVKCLWKGSIAACLRVIAAGTLKDMNKLAELMACLAKLQEEKYWKVDNNWSIEW